MVVEDDEEGEGEVEEEEGAVSSRASTWKPTVLSPVFYALYGFILMNSQSFQTAISESLFPPSSPQAPEAK